MHENPKPMRIQLKKANKKAPGPDPEPPPGATLPVSAPVLRTGASTH